jgi:hypothetical protein
MDDCRFYNRLKAAAEDDPKASMYVQILISSVEFNTFVRLMRIMRPIAEAKLALQVAEAKTEGHALKVNSSKLDDEETVDDKESTHGSADEKMTSRVAVSNHRDRNRHAKELDDYDDDYRGDSKTRGDEEEDVKSSKK